MVRLCGAVLGFLAFAATIVLGLGAGNSVDEILRRAIWALVVFCLLGVGVGWVASRVIDDYALRRHRELLGPLEDDESADDADATTPRSAAPSRPRSPGAETRGQTGAGAA